MTLFQKIISTNAAASLILIRLMVGAVFLTEGIQKFLFPSEVGAGRFAKIGIPSPDVLGPFVGVFETVCGTFVLLGLLTRVAASPSSSTCWWRFSRPRFRCCWATVSGASASAKFPTTVLGNGARGTN